LPEFLDRPTGVTLDLQKAETQAREARIETSLERVRARTMAMHSSDDVGAATATMFIELEKIGYRKFSWWHFHYQDGSNTGSLVSK